MSNRDGSSHAAVYGCVREYVRQHGKKLGLYLAAEAIGISERVARHAYDGTPFAADAERAARADAARLKLLNDTIAALTALRDQVERARNAEASNTDARHSGVRPRPGHGALAHDRKRVDRHSAGVLA